MASHLQQLLRSLCWNSEWNYAVFWKLKHRARMVLTWEDAFYNDHFKIDPLGSNRFGEALESLHDGHVAHDPVGLAVAKMSYHVYSLGEGVVGQVAVTGKHRWIFAGEHAMNSFSSLELCDGWQAQFAAGIKTIVVAAVVPHGVVQLGSLNKVDENLQLLTQIRCLFSSLQDSACHIQTPIQSSLQNMLQMSDMPAKNFGPDVLQECLLDNKTTNKENTFSSPLELQSPKRHLVDSFASSLPGVHLSEAVELMRKNGLIQSISENQQSSDLVTDANCGSNIYKIQSGVTVAGRQIFASSQSCLTENSALYDAKLSAEKSRVRLDGGDHLSEKKVQTMAAPDPWDKLKAEENTNNQSELSCLDALGSLQSSVMFSAGNELHEALGPAFSKQCYPWSWDSENPEERLASQMPEAMESSLLTTDSGADHLLEAVVANFCHKDATFKSAKSLSTSESMLTTEKMPEPSINTSRTIGSSSYYSIGCSSLLEESTQNCLNSSESCSIKSSTSSYREQLVKPTEPGKPNKKRARPGESSRPRPRDRQLIQDRIKELRELVPNGSKCSIDSLLERTIKHMIFMQSVNKHADKLSNCVKSKGCSNEIGVSGAGYEQGSSWAVEVGGHMKICPIVVENLNMNGQMLIEMLCEDSDHFLEIAEAIRSLGLTVLKGLTDNHGDKTWMRFVVESQSNRNLHRMDVLWSLVQLLQSKTTV